QQPRVQALSTGWWANRFAVLAALQQALSRVAPLTAQALSDARAFRDPMPWQQLWAALPQLGPVPSASPQRPQREISLLGIVGTEETLDAELAKSSAGQIGVKLQGAVDPALDLSRFRGTRAEATAGRKGRGGGSGGVPRVSAENNRDKELNGFLGE